MEKVMNNKWMGCDMKCRYLSQIQSIIPPSAWRDFKQSKWLPRPTSENSKFHYEVKELTTQVLYLF